MNTWDQTGEFIFAIMIGFGILYIIGTIMCTLNTLPLIAAITAITLTLSIAYVKTKKNNKIGKDKNVQTEKM